MKKPSRSTALCYMIDHQGYLTFQHSEKETTEGNKELQTETNKVKNEDI